MATGTFLDGLFDNARGVFKDVIDFEKFKFELALAKDARAAEAAQARSQAPTPPAASLSLSSPLVVLGGLAVVGVVLARVLR